MYCKKRLWLFFSKEEPFCSKVHEAAYYDELSAMRRLMEFTDPIEPPAIPPLAVPPLCDFVGERGRLEPVTADLVTAPVLFEAQPFAGPIQFPSSGLDSVSEPAAEIVEIASATIGPCRARPRRSRRIAPRSPAAFSSRTHRRRLG
jgi:hypothetical protein